MPHFPSPESPESKSPRIGILLSNLGSPAAPRSPELRRFLRQFLSDRRVVELPRWKWWPILNLFILPFRPRRSAAAYSRIWAETGSPLLHETRTLAAKVGELLGSEVAVAAGMRYGDPSIPSALSTLLDLGCQKILHLPLYPQYSASTSGSNWDSVVRELSHRRCVPAFAQIAHYARHPSYITALASSLRELWSAHGPPEQLLISFHGIPQSYVDQGDPYPRHCEATAQLLAQELELDPKQWGMAYQSRFGRDPWIGPATDETLIALGKAKCPSVDVLCPGFAVDCLETLEEIAIMNRDLFKKAGGGRFRYVPALNSRPEHVQAVVDILEPQLSCWRREETKR